jgi:hypothetical protein
MYMYISIFYVVTQTFEKNRYSLCPTQKKDKNIHREKAYFSTNFFHFYIDHIRSWFLLKQLCRHVEHGHIHKTFFCFEFFDVFKYIKNIFQIKGAYAPESKKASPAT